MSRDAAPIPTARSWLAAAGRLLDRHPWLLPLLSFAIGWLGFLLFQRGERVARGVALLALLGWPWLFVEAWLGRWLVGWSRGRLNVGAVRFLTQQVQQEILFFALPFLLGASAGTPGHVLFMGVALAVALLVTLDPIYLQRLAPHPVWSGALHAYCTLVAALVVLPVVLHLPLDRALPLALAITGASLLLSLPRVLLSVSGSWRRLRVSAAVLLVPAAVWLLRGWIPPAGLWVRQAQISAEVRDLQPGPARTRFDLAQASREGVAAFVAVRAPAGLSQAVAFEWWHDGRRYDRIPATISGGREAGFRTWSRKQNFPADATGAWHVDLLTPDDQLIARLRFRIDG